MPTASRGAGPRAGRTPHGAAVPRGELRTPDGRDTFLEAFGGGLFAESIVHGEKHDDAGPEKVEIGLRLLRRLVEELPARPWRLELDGADESGDYVSVEALAIGLTGPSIPLAPRSDPADALLDVVAVSDADRHAFATYLDARIAGRDAEAPKLTARRCCEASLWPPKSQPLRLDDELIEDAHWRSNGGHAAVAAGAVLEVLAPE